MGPSQGIRYRRRAIGRGAAAVAAVALVVIWVAGAKTPISASTAAEPNLTVDHPRLIVLKGKRLLHLLDGNRVVRTYAIDLGSDPIGDKRLAGDGRTPEGVFRVCVKREDSPHHRFLGIDYPDENAVAAGLAAGLLSAGEAAGLRSGHREHPCPDWSTNLGGGIGIHGQRRGQDWTAGCIAVSNEQIEELFAIVRIGDPVEILP